MGIVHLFDGRVMGVVVARGWVQDRCTRGGRPDGTDGWHKSRQDGRTRRGDGTRQHETAQGVGGPRRDEMARGAGRTGWAGASV